MVRRLSLAAHGALMVGAWLAAVWLSGCAATLTTAWGEHALARINAPAVACPQVHAPPAVSVGEKRTVTVDRDGKVGPDDVVTTTVTEPAFAPQPEIPPAHESRGAKISAGGKSFGLGLLKGVACILTVGVVCLP